MSESRAKVIELEVGDLPKGPEQTPERQAVWTLAERISNDSHWGIAWFEHGEGGATAYIDTAEGVEEFVEPKRQIPEGKTQLMPFRVDEESRGLKRVVTHPEMIKDSGVYGMLAQIGPEAYEVLKERAEANPVVAKGRLEADPRTKRDSKHGESFWKVFLQEKGMEDHLQLRWQDDHLAQPGFES